MPTIPGTGVIAHAIQLAIAPVFLLTGIAGLLNVMAARLARVIDRTRSFEEMWAGLDTKARAAARVELGSLERRRRACSWSINYCTTAALLICVVIVALFVEEFFSTTHGRDLVSQAEHEGRERRTRCRATLQVARELQPLRADGQREESDPPRRRIEAME